MGSSLTPAKNFAVDKFWRHILFHTSPGDEKREGGHKNKRGGGRMKSISSKNKELKLLLDGEVSIQISLPPKNIYIISN